MPKHAKIRSFLIHETTQVGSALRLRYWAAALAAGLWQVLVLPLLVLFLLALD
jgi:hypothetical protein